MAAAATGPSTPKTLILCFDGTGNKFQGTPTDSNSKSISHNAVHHLAETFSHQNLQSA